MLTVKSTFSVLLCPLFPKIVRHMEKMLILRRAGSAPGLQKRAGDPERGLLSLSRNPGCALGGNRVFGI